MWADKGHDHNVPTDVYLSFVSSLFDNRFTLFTGMVVHILTFVTVYVQTGASFYLLLCACFVLVFSFRLHSFFMFDREDKTKLTREQIADFARLTGDTNPLHFDTVAAQWPALRPAVCGSGRVQVHQ